MLDDDAGNDDNDRLCNAVQTQTLNSDNSHDNADDNALPCNK